MGKSNTRNSRQRQHSNKRKRRVNNTSKRRTRQINKINKKRRTRRVNNTKKRRTRRVKISNKIGGAVRLELKLKKHPKVYAKHVLLISENDRYYFLLAKLKQFAATEAEYTQTQINRINEGKNQSSQHNANNNQAGIDIKKIRYASNKDTLVKIIDIDVNNNKVLVVPNRWYDQFEQEIKIHTSTGRSINELSSEENVRFRNGLFAGNGYNPLYSVEFADLKEVRKVYLDKSAISAIQADQKIATARKEEIINANLSPSFPPDRTHDRPVPATSHPVPRNTTWLLFKDFDAVYRILNNKNPASHTSNSTRSSPSSVIDPSLYNYELNGLSTGESKFGFSNPSSYEDNHQSTVNPGD